MNSRDTNCVSVLTPSGRGAVAVVAVEGSAALISVDRYFQAVNGRSLSEQPLGRIVYGHWGDADSPSKIGEDLVVCRRSSERLEVHCHGGRQSSAQIVSDLTADGCSVIQADEWLAHHHDCPLTASAHRALAKATTLRTATILLDQYHGALRCEVEAIEIELSAGKTAEARDRIEHLVQYGQLGRHLNEPWRVVIAGLPNVGKSSLINALVGYQRAIVFDQPGTTRDIVSSNTAIEGWPVELSDTAGLRETSLTSEIEGIESAGIALARQRILAADLVIWVLDAAALSPARDLSNRNRAEQQAQAARAGLDFEKTLIVINKIDVAESHTDQGSQSVGTCAVSGEGIGRLLEEIVARLVPRIPPPNAAVPFTVAQVEVLQAALDAIGKQDRFTASTILRSWLAGRLAPPFP